MIDVMYLGLGLVFFLLSYIIIELFDLLFIEP